MAVFKIDMSKRALQPFGKMKKDKVKQNEGKAKSVAQSFSTTCLH